MGAENSWIDAQKKIVADRLKDVPDSRKDTISAFVTRHDLPIESEAPANTVTISKKEYDYLIARDTWLDCLESAGVDNWQGYDFAVEMDEDDSRSVVHT